METAALSPALIRDYNRILGDLVNVITEEQLPQILRLMEPIADPVEDLRQAIESNQATPLFPRWRDALRLIRLSFALQGSLSAEYDGFVIAYQNLSGKTKRDADENRLLEEISALMYRIDELNGEQERHCLRLLAEMSQAMKAVFGVMMEADPGALENPLTAGQQQRLVPAVQDLVQLLGEQARQARIMFRLKRLRKLIVDL